MPVITVNDQPHVLHPGQNRLGEGADADVRIGGDAALGIQAIVDVGDGHPVIRRATTVAAVRVNGVALVDPTPLMHGDKVEIGGTELLYSDDSKSGSTRLMSLSEIAALAAPSSAVPRATSATGGRLVSLVDGKEYHVGPEGLTIGRDAGSTVVIAQDDVSRRHAIVVPVDNGYELRDVSVNGVLVNGARVDGRRLLSQSDVIQIGSEEFRFHADAVPPASAEAPRVKKPPPVVPAADLPPALAILSIISSGPSNGRHYEIRVPLAHIGRGAHNDVSINDSSVSDSHAKFQYRDRAWFITDLGSRNGTYVGGVRFTGERRLYGNVELRVGNVKLMFRPTGVVLDIPQETRAIATVDRSSLRPTSAAAQVAVTTPSTLPQQGPSAWMWTVVVVAMVAVAALFLLNR
jgi:pSer/pThr/pTyr-binding forkhead associated (FHA) protein